MDTKVRLLVAFVVAASPFATLVQTTGCNPCSTEFIGQSVPTSCLKAASSSSGDSGAGGSDAPYTPPPTHTSPPSPPPTATSVPVLVCGQPGADAAIPDADAATPDASCNTMSCGPIVEEKYVGGTMPMPVGGDIPPGTYALTALDNYGGGTGTTGYTLQESYEYEGANFNRVSGAGSIDGGLGSVSRSSGTFSTSDTQITWTEGCGGFGFSVGYSFEDDTFRTFFGAREYIYSPQQ